VKFSSGLLKVNELSRFHHHGFDPYVLKLLWERHAQARLFAVTGLVYGTATIQAVDKAGRVQASMHVAMKRRQLLAVTVNLVRYKTKGAATDLQLEQVDTLLAATGAIIGTQANVFMQKHKADWLPVTVDVLSYTNPHAPSSLARQTWPDLIKADKTRADPDVDAHVFFVDAINIHEGNQTRSSPGLTVGKDVAIPRKPSLEAYARTLVHEMLHVLGLSAEKHRHGDTEHIMGLGKKIPKDIVNRINR
jgi:hypothetical protein